MVSVTFGAALTEIVIVYDKELYADPSCTWYVNVTSSSEFAAGVNFKYPFPKLAAVISKFSVTSLHVDPSVVYSKVPEVSNPVILIFDIEAPASTSLKLKSLAAKTFVIFDGVLSPAEDTWLFSLT